MARSSSREGAAIDAEVRSFFRAIKENPDDDTPRLIFADWLQEHGDATLAARGEFLRLNVLRHRISPDDPRHDALKRREAEIITRHQWDWLGPLPDTAHWAYERGMLRITARAEKLISPEIQAWTQGPTAFWIDSLELWHLAPDHIPILVNSRLLAHLNGLDLLGNANEIGFQFLVRALRTQEMGFLTRLALAGCRLTERHIEALALWPELQRLTFLDLRRNRLNDAAARRLAESPHLRNLAVLRLRRNCFSAAGVALLREAFGDRVQL